MWLSKVRTLGVVVGVLAVAAVSAVGCSGSDFSASSDGGDAGVSSGGLAGSSSASAGRGGHAAAGTSAGGMSEAGEGGAPSEAGAAGEGAGTGGSGGASGAAGTAEAGAGGEAGGCEVAWFPDGDHDGFGRSSGEVVACTAPSSGTWVTQGKDCNDDNKLVSPAVMDFKPTGYTTSGSAVSFDYDCSGIEEVDPTAKGPAPACSALNCTGVGFQYTNRTGPGVNALCGSTAQVTCTKSGLNCLAVVTQVAQGIRCH